MKTVSNAILIAVSLLSLCVASAPAATNTLQIYNFGFGTNSTPVNPTINLGDTVTWVWASGGIPHSTTAAPGQLESWNSGTMSAVGATFSHTFSQLGTFNYYCTIHGSSTGCRGVGGMSGHIVVVHGSLATPYQVDAITQQGSDILVDWITGGICFTNILQRSIGDANGGYTNDFTDIFTVTNTVGNTTNFLDPGAATNFPSSYYRIRVP